MSNESDALWVREYFKEMRAEINLRITNHTSLVALKIVTAGGLLAFMLTETTTDLPVVNTVGFLVVPLVALLFDVMIAKNFRNILMIGTFIRDRIEIELPEKIMWEKYAGQANKWTRCYGTVDVIVLSLFTIGTGLIALYVLENNNSVWLIPSVIGLSVGFLAVLSYMLSAITYYVPPKALNKHKKR